jgi:hypothetical protein
LNKILGLNTERTFKYWKQHLYKSNLIEHFGKHSFDLHSFMVILDIAKRVLITLKTMSSNLYKEILELNKFLCFQVENISQSIGSSENFRVHNIQKMTFCNFSLQTKCTIILLFYSITLQRIVQSLLLPLSCTCLRVQKSTLGKIKFAFNFLNELLRTFLCSYLRISVYF